MAAQLRIAQFNVQHGLAATENLRRLLDMGDIKIALLQEPYYYNDSLGALNGIKGKIFVKMGSQRPRALVYTSITIEAMMLEQYSSRDFVTIKIKYSENKVKKYLIVCSGYFPYDSIESPPPKEMVDIIDYAKNNNMPIIIGCDANAHHTIWGSSDINNRGEALLEYIYSVNLDIKNEGNTPTFITSNREEVLDITVCSLEISENINNWHVSKDDSLSDHQIIFYDFWCDRPDPITYRNPRDTDLDLFESYVSGMILGWRYVQPSIVALDEAAKHFTESFSRFFELSCPERTISEKTKTIWWNPSLKRLKKRNNYYWNHRDRFQHFRSFRKDYKKSIRTASRQSFHYVCNSINSLAATARLHKLYSLCKNVQVNSIMLPCGNFAKDEIETLQCLLQTHFPDCSNNSPVIDIIQQHDCISDEILCKIVTKNNIRWAINSFKPYKSPGSDNISPKLLQHSLELIVNPLEQLFKTSLKLGYIPTAWQSVRVTFIPKPGKNTYNEPKNYRPISLTSFLLKSIERLVDNYIRDNCLTISPLHARQHSYQKGKSTETALHEVVGRIEKAMSTNEVCLAAFLDVQGAFDNTTYETIANGARMHSIHEGITFWITSLLKQRRLNAVLRGSLVNMTPSRGCPQGGVLSPLLWNMVADEILHLLNSSGYYTVGYADDFVILIQGKFIDTVFDQMQGGLKLVERWCNKTDLFVNPNKSSLVLFTRRRNKEGIRTLKMFEQVIPLVNEIRYLGIILDSKLNWKSHIDNRYNKATKILGQCRRFVGQNWGLKPKYMLWLFNMIIKPVMTYGSLVWWSKTNQVTIQNKLNKLQRLACLSISGAFKTTPTLAMETMLNIQPLHIEIKREALKSAIRLKNLGLFIDNYNGGHRSIFKLLSSASPLLSVASDRITPQLIIEKNFTIHISETREWSGEWPIIRPPNAITIFTDGSKIRNLAGAGIFCEEFSWEISLSLGRHATVFQTELHALYQSAKKCNEMGVVDKTICFLTDSKSILQSLSRCSTNSNGILDCFSELNILGCSNEVFLIWIPAHFGIYGNEIADICAKKGASSSPIGPEPFLPLASSTVSQMLLEWSMQEHKKIWESTDSCRQTKILIKQPSQEISKRIIHFTRPKLRFLIGMITGHFPVNDHLFKMNLSSTRLCRFCEADVESTYHLLCLCSKFSTNRKMVLGSEYLSSNAYSSINIKKIISFLSVESIIHLNIN